jgi:hypothetical protein
MNEWLKVIGIAWVFLALSVYGEQAKQPPKKAPTKVEQKIQKPAELAKPAPPAQAEQKPATPEVKPDPNLPVLPPGLALEIRSLQLENAQVTIEKQFIEKRYVDLQNLERSNSAKMNELWKSAIKAAGADGGKYELNFQTLKFQAKPRPEDKKPDVPPQKP